MNKFKKVLIFVMLLALPVIVGFNSTDVLATNNNIDNLSVQDRSVSNPYGNVAIPNLATKENLGEGQYQLWESSSGINVKYNIYTGIFSFNGTSTGFPRVLDIKLPGGFYTFNIEDVSNSPNGNEPRISAYTSSEYKDVFDFTKQSMPYTTKTQIYGFRLWTNKDQTFNNYQFKLMVNEGTTAQPYSVPDVFDQVPFELSVNGIDDSSYDQTFEVRNSDKDYTYLEYDYNWEKLTFATKIGSEHDDFELNSEFQYTLSSKFDRLDLYYNPDDLNSYIDGSDLSKLSVIRNIQDYKIEANYGYGDGFAYIELIDDLGNRTVLNKEEYDDSKMGIMIMIKPNLSSKRLAISGSEYFASDIDNPTPVEKFVAELSAYDAYDGDLSDQIIIEEDNYTPNINKVGVYQVKVSVTDSNDNYSDFIFNVILEDTAPPTAVAEETYVEVSYDELFDLEAYRKKIQVSDNYYDSSDLTVILTSETYTSNSTNLGMYHAIYTITDPSENSTTLRLDIKVTDGVAPIISGLTDYRKPWDKIVSVNDIIANVTAYDEKDGVLSIYVISDTFTGNGNRVGKYQVIVGAKDTAGNEARHEINIEVYDDQGADWYITNGTTLNLPSEVNYTRSQIINLLGRNDIISLSPNAIITYQRDTYSDNIGVVGTYQLHFNVKEQNGTSTDHKWTIKLLGENPDDSEQVPPKLTILERLKDWFKRNLAKIIIIVVLAGAGLLVYSKVSDEIKRNKRRK